MQERSGFDPVIWEDVKLVTDDLQKQIDYLSTANDELLNDFCDLISILVDANLPPELKQKISEKFISPKTETK